MRKVSSPLSFGVTNSLFLCTVQVHVGVYFWFLRLETKVTTKTKYLLDILYSTLLDERHCIWLIKGPRGSNGSLRLRVTIGFVLLAFVLENCLRCATCSAR